jgi:uncharacterized protein
MNTPTPPAPTGAEIDDILSSIRESVAAEGPKVGSNEDLINAAAEEGADDDILELTPAELTTPAPAAPVANEAANVEDILGVPSVPANDTAADEFDKLLAEIGQEKQQRAAEVQAQKEALLADVEPLGTEPEPIAQLAPEALAELQAESHGPEETLPATPIESPATPLPATGTHTLGALQTAEGMQLVLPAEVLAVALRPMVQGWLEANLPKVVEQLVQAEIAKLNQ